MDCATFKELVALFALGALEPGERERCETHLAAEEHDGCLEILSETMASVSSLDGDGRLPSPRAWEAITEQIAPSARRIRGARRRAAVAAGLAVTCAAALVLVVVSRSRVAGQLGATRMQLSKSERSMTAALDQFDSCRARVEEIDRDQRLRDDAVSLLHLPGTQLFPLTAKPGQAAAANAIIHTGLRRAYVVADGLTPMPDRDYEVWVAKGKKVVSAGVVAVDRHGRALVRVDYTTLLGEAGAPDAMMITLEPRGGPIRAPGMTVLFGAPRG